MKLEDMCLTIEQARELKELGIDFSNSMLCFYEIEGVMYIGYNGIFDYDETLGHTKQPTLTITEMLEMLPKVLDYGGIRDEQPLWLTSGKQWSVLFHGPINELDYESISDSLRDALFDMIKWLKINKII